MRFEYVFFRFTYFLHFTGKRQAQIRSEYSIRTIRIFWIGEMVVKKKHTYSEMHSNIFISIQLLPIFLGYTASRMPFSNLNFEENNG